MSKGKSANRNQNKQSSNNVDGSNVELNSNETNISEEVVPTEEVISPVIEVTESAAEQPSIVAENNYNYVAELVQKSYNTASCVAEQVKQHIPASVNEKFVTVAEQVKQRIPASVNEKFVTKACDLWSAIHSTPAPVALKDFQSQLLSLYTEVLNGRDEIKETLRTSRNEPVPVRVRRVSKAAVLVSIRGLTAVVDFAEQSINLVLPAPAEDESAPVTVTDKIQSLVQSRAIDRIPAGLPKRMVVIPFNVTFRVAKQINLRGIDALHFLNNATQNHIDQLAKRFAEARLRVESGVNTARLAIADKVDQNAHIQKIKDVADNYSKRIVQLRREIFEHAAKQIPTQQVAAFRESLKSCVEKPKETAEAVKSALLKRYETVKAQWAAYIPTAPFNVSVTGVSAFSNELVEKLKNKRNVLLALTAEKRDTTVRVFNEKKEKYLDIVNEKTAAIKKLIKTKQEEVTAAVQATVDSTIEQVKANAYVQSTVSTAVAQKDAFLATETGKKVAQIAKESYDRLPIDKVKSFLPSFIASHL